MSAGRSSLPRRIPYAGIWIDNYSLTAVPGGALLAGGVEWHPDGIGSRSQTTGGAAFWDASSGTSEPTAVAEIWNPETRTWSLGRPLAVPRAGHRLAAVDAGMFLVVGNHAPSPEAPPETSWELWRPGV